MIISEEGVDMVLEMARQPVRDTKARKLAPEQQGQGSKADRCHYTEEYQREDSRTGIPRRSLVSMSVLLKYLIMILLLQLKN